MRVVLMGAGHIGQTIATLLSDTSDFKVKVVDRSVQALHPLAHLPIETALIDTSDTDALNLIRSWPLFSAQRQPEFCADHALASATGLRHASDVVCADGGR